jgi:hypothetical protein
LIPNQTGLGVNPFVVLPPTDIANFSADFAVLGVVKASAFSRATTTHYRNTEHGLYRLL